MNAWNRRAALTAALSDLVPGGWQLVPKEHTIEMQYEFIRVAGEGQYPSGEGFGPSYKAMLAIAPLPSSLSGDERNG